jgi:hypothetical protein
MRGTGDGDHHMKRDVGNEKELSLLYICVYIYIVDRPCTYLPYMSM